MNWIDYVILGVIGFSVLVSSFRGFVKEALSVVIWFGAFFIASNFYTQLAAYFTNIQDEMIRNGVAITTLFIVTLVVGAVLNYVIAQLVQKTGLSGTDRVLGIVFGGVRGVLIVVALLFLLDVFTRMSGSIDWKQSLLVPKFRIINEWFLPYVEPSSSFLPKVTWGSL
ncbi:CvpA family protein [Candidatus Enterovibrio escicola]|uniref:CvpA family protein n=1 Tax=Candidatus Enterovibrio escicola TaxID=1927127 RepID=UPI0012382D7A|nr:CvpA family protein [Candidatus Enterovibrio escacola]